MGHEDAVYLAKLAEQAERYEGMCCMSKNSIDLACLFIDRALTLGARAFRRDGREHEDCRL